MGPVWQSVVKEQEPLFARILTACPILQRLAGKKATLKRGTLKRLGHDQHDLIMPRREWDMHSSTFHYTLRSMISRTASPRPSMSTSINGNSGVPTRVTQARLLDSCKAFCQLAHRFSALDLESPPLATSKTPK